MAFGEILRNARVQKGLTPSDVAESTHMLVQVVEGLEQEDFRRIAAPIYGRGFVKLYAELLELDPEPLISDFMNLYSGARAPAVLTKNVEPAPEPAPAPQTRAVSEPAAAVRVPQRQPVQPRPAVRAVAVPEPSERSDVPPPEVPELRVADEATDAEPAAPRVRAALPREAGGASEAKKDFRPSLVVEPEEAYDENDDLDLFRAASSVARPVREGDPCPVDETEHARAETKGLVARKGKLPIFQIGGRMDRDELPTLEDEEAHARRHARMQTFLDGISRLKDGVERHLPLERVPRQVWVFGGLGVLMVVLMAAGIMLLFRLTGTDVKTDPAGRFARAAPPPMYVD
ncbi:MAG: helix-turn-helix domain-containing protein [Kiritimatiellia bacterium]|jgi:transcriptional regulator with XRE-family HTH domain|nr:helix-turn-helix domain-containing protein [Kiritimatiellia bacterium]MDD4173712.1 helix-turn-helix domain-containing protein [Kiritimatiellia bacterium]MDD4441555.1 helix-turn-helix domain-containing protein [Kiritimatiellia bacterium]MDX9793372.1 helix-turn-helix domain-containing protein [Kiritimatiellia bacterium]NLC80254.1 hypothetical protein [Lentisphaerota bacterium]